MTTPDTRTPDELSDADRERIMRDAFGFAADPVSRVTAGRVIDATLRALAARPAPASVEALRKKARAELTEAVESTSRERHAEAHAACLAGAAAIDALAVLAASTPPAEAQPAESKRSTDAWNKVRAEARTLAPGRGLGDLLTAVLEFGAAQAADPHARFLYGDDATPPASVARVEQTPPLPSPFPQRLKGTT